MGVFSKQKFLFFELPLDANVRVNNVLWVNVCINVLVAPRRKLVNACGKSETRETKMGRASRGMKLCELCGAR